MRKELLYGAAYYDEYMPYDRLEEDAAMMKKAGINVVRIAESTWSTCEPADGVFDFSHVTRVLDVMEREGIHVIIGTPTYAVPHWMVKKYPEILATTHRGQGVYGSRQIMDITDPHYLFYAERVIRELMKVTAHRSCVIGFQIDNETKHYDTAGTRVQAMFGEYLKEKFQGDCEAMNREFGLAYWSNRIADWDDLPDVRGTINGSLRGEFERFRRELVTRFLRWQADIVNEYRRPDQFITHNFDFEWRGWSFGVQPDVNHLHAARALTLAGCDIYHPNQDELTGAEIAFGGDMTRCLKQDNYLVIETEAQGFPCWTPYPGQLRLCAYSHLASGADGVMYWHWHSIHNSLETYWKGLLSHDLKENAAYREACVVGNEWQRLSPRLMNLKKKNSVAILVSNESLTALKNFGIRCTPGDTGDVFYNDVLRWIYDALYRMNIECDFLWPESTNLSDYRMIVLPALYAVPDETLLRLKAYAAEGGCLVSTFKTAFANEHTRVSHESQPRILSEVFGVTYDQFTFPKEVGLAGALYRNEEDSQETSGEARVFMELLRPTTAQVLASYVHPAWGTYAAITENGYGAGAGYYLGCMTDDTTLEHLLRRALSHCEIAIPKLPKGVILREGTNRMGETIRYYLNFTDHEQHFPNPREAAEEVVTGKFYDPGEEVTLPAWGVAVMAHGRE